MAYNTELGFDDAFDYEKELKRTDISDSYRRSLQSELQKRNDYEANQPKITNPEAPKPAQAITLGDDYTYADTEYEYVESPEVTRARATTNAILGKINSGKTSFSDSLKNIIGKIQGRESFAYDFNSDPLFQQALNSSMMSGQVAMQDTMGQAAALTGGYGSSYGTAVANNVYNQYIQSAYDQIPDFYNMALQQYQIEGDELYRQYAMLSEQDATEFGRLMDTYSANFNNATYLDERDYSRYRDSISDARYEDETAYNRAWDEKTWNYQVEQDALAQQNWETQFEYGKEQDALAQQNWETQFEYGKEQDSKNWEFTYEQWEYKQKQDAKSEEDYINQNDWNGDGKVDVNDYYASPEYKQYIEERNYNREQDAKSEEDYINQNDWNGDRKVDVNDAIFYQENILNNTSEKDLTPYIEKIKTLESSDQIDDYLGELGELGLLDENEQRYLQVVYGKPEALSLNKRTWTLSYDGGGNHSGWIDEDARFKDQYGNEYTAMSIYNMLVEDGWSESEAEDYVLKLQYDLGAANQMYGKKYNTNGGD